jgi:hypothetical protein
LLGGSRPESVCFRDYREPACEHHHTTPSRGIQSMAAAAAATTIAATAVAFAFVVDRHCKRSNGTRNSMARFPTARQQRNV